MTVSEFFELFDNTPDAEFIGDWPVLINDALTRQQKGVLDVMWDAENERCLIELDGRIAR